MQNYKFQHCPEIQERLIFPFVAAQARGPCNSDFLQSSETLKHQSSSKLRLSTGGLVITEHLHSGSTKGHSKDFELLHKHSYSPKHAFGHFLPENDMNHLLGYQRVGDYTRTSEDIGRHHRHPRQLFSHARNFRTKDDYTNSGERQGSF